MLRSDAVRTDADFYFTSSATIGGPGSETISGTPGRDILAGGAGSDLVRGGLGADRFLFVPAFNPAGDDVYRGGAGRDTLTLVISGDLWLDPAFQQDIAAWLAWLAEPAATRGDFVFTAIGLTVGNIERLVIYVDGRLVTLRDDELQLAADDLVVNHDAAGLSGDLLANDIVPDRVAEVRLGELPAHGTVTVNPDGTFLYVPDPATAGMLAPGEVLVDSFTYTVVDADGDVRTAVATVTIVGPPNGFEVLYLEPGDSSGVAVASAGDINGDGIDDFMIGGPSVGADGVVYVIFGVDRGNGTAFLPDVALDALDGTNGFVIRGKPDAGNPGHSIASLGDVNGDGIDDIVIGASAHREHGQGDPGTAYVIFGTDAGFGAVLDLADIDGSNGFAIIGASVDDKLGYKVAAAGDVNGDGIADIIVGGYGVDPDGMAQAGAAYVVYGTTTGFDAVIDVSTLNGTNGFAIPGLSTENRTGHSVAGIGDVNGDGIDDIAVGAYGATVRNDPESGEIYVIFGTTDWSDPTFDLASLDGTNGYVLRGADAGDYAGRNVAAIGDINSDGFDDFAIGGYGYPLDSSTDKDGTVYVILGGVPAEDPPFDGVVNLATLDGTRGFTIAASDPEDLLGRTIAGVGDVNGDGIDDFMIGAPDADPGGQQGAGEAYLIFGQAGGFGAEFDLDSLDGSNGYVFDGVLHEEHAGYAVSSAGDIDGDGINDILIGSYGEEFTNSPQTYGIYVIYGGRDSLDALDARDGERDGVIDLALLKPSDEFIF